MASRDSTQTYANHAMLVPAFHYFILPVMTMNVGWAGVTAFRAPSATSVFAVVVAVALLFIAFYARVFALKVQDRVIRLEMRLKMREILPDELQPRINDFTIEQLVGMRFACDDELAELAAAVLKDNVRDRKAIKQMVKTWTADTARC